MFAGLSGLSLNDAAKEITGMNSREGEVVEFFKPVSLKNEPKIHEWLTAVENEMKETLATNLEHAVTALMSMGPSDKDAYLTWIDKYPTQLILIASQVVWSQGVEKSLAAGQLPSESLKYVENTLNTLAGKKTNDWGILTT